MTRKVKKKIRRRPGQKRNMYFTMETQEAIVKYQTAEGVERDNRAPQQLHYAQRRRARHVRHDQGPPRQVHRSRAQLPQHPE